MKIRSGPGHNDGKELCRKGHNVCRKEFFHERQSTFRLYGHWHRVALINRVRHTGVLVQVISRCTRFMDINHNCVPEVVVPWSSKTKCNPQSFLSTNVVVI